MKVSALNIALFLGIILFGYFFIFIKSKQYLSYRSASHDGFVAVQRPGVQELKKGDSIPVEQDAGADLWTKPYTTEPIQKVDDYDHDIVFDNEGDRQYSQAQINNFTSQRPFEWPGLPPSAMKFQQKQAQWMVDATRAEPARESKYETIEGFAALPPDNDSIEAEERKLLQTYAPACSKDLKYDVDDAMELINKIYAKKGKQPMVHVREDGVYEVFEEKELNPKIVYEDEAETAAGRLAPADFNEAKFEVPQEASDRAAGLDPFFEPGTRTRSGRSDYMQWTPGLERSFAPNQPMTNWY